jgi:2-oxo-4-hydroxy-4-carboxy-5-ureidoimidazoline decarboxylase
MSGVTDGRDVVTALSVLDETNLEATLASCCGSTTWVERVLAAWPYEDDATLRAAAEEAWWSLTETDWLEAFAAHPRIGDRDLADQWAGAEQAGVEEAEPETLAELATGNREYEARFGHVFLICATGLSAEQMLGALRRRLRNEAGVELQVAASEQARITALRLARLAHEPAPLAVNDERGVSNTLSTHVLDTTTGRPATGVEVELSRAGSDGWRPIAAASTDEDGRIAALALSLPDGLGPGEYRLRFATGAYFRSRDVEAFHPSIDVVFRIASAGGHHHVPLLVSPFGYTTYRGS